MAVIVLSDADLAFGHVPLLAKAAFSLEDGQRVGLIGRNGTGKSSLLKILAGTENLDYGSLQLQQGLRVTYLPQEPVFAHESSVFDAVAEGLTQAREARSAYESLSLSMQTEDDHHALDALQSQCDALQAWDWERRVEAQVSLLGIAGDLPVATLSGGQKKRVAIARVLAEAPGVLLLDEPTNHLDLEAIEWLETVLLGFNGALVFVTHDRAFLDRVCTDILELDRGVLRLFPGNFTAYQRAKEDQLAAEALANARAYKLLAQEEAWSRQGVEARRTKSMARLERLEILRGQRAARREQVGQVRLEVSRGERSGKVVADLQRVSYGYAGKPLVVKDLTLTVLRGDKLGLLGPNGAGKTTLLRLILGTLAAQSGTIVQGSRLSVAYFDQMREGLRLDASLEDTISPGSEWIEIGPTRKHVKSYLQDFLFAPERSGSPVSSLSGGERNRLLLARLFARPANVLVLDEPTNDLDIETLELLEGLLQDFNGTVLLVSHDRAFLDGVVTSMVAYEGQGQWLEYEGGYEDYVAQRARRMASLAPAQSSARSSTVGAPANVQAITPASIPAKALKLNSKEKKELEGLPEKIELLEEQLKALHAQLADPNLYKNAPLTVPEIEAQAKGLEGEIAAAMARWEALLARPAA
ncbi:MAG: ATP-binding cassette domain-containing protein [Betaproteobacteria bacterium]|nr:ATP-binding cassette domain-containing protein [Betaproteobacteria bacterium]